MTSQESGNPAVTNVRSVKIWIRLNSRPLGNDATLLTDKPPQWKYYKWLFKYIDK